MSVLIEDINNISIKIDELIKKEHFEEAYEQYKLADESIEAIKYTTLLSTDELGKYKISEFYSSYAYFLFSVQEYGEFFNIYIKAQRYGYSAQKRRNFIYKSFIEPNLDTLKSNYNINIENMRIKNSINVLVEFDDLPYWLITTGNENEYYVYEKETDLIKDKILLDINYKKLYDDDYYDILFDYLVIDTNDGDAIYKDIGEIIPNGKKIYIVTDCIHKLLSYFQGFIADEKLINQLTIFGNDKEFKNYFINSNDYLPRTLLCNNEKEIEYLKIIEDIHEYRLTKQGRCGDNILLSICIPSYNRGKRAYDNVIHTLKTEFDEEIEVVVSNNGTQNASKIYYEDIKSIDDSRLVYFEFDTNQGFSPNVCKAVDLASGKYILTLSDEDMVNIEELKFLVSILNSSKDNLSIIRTKSDGQGGVPFVGMKKKGKDALFTFMLTSNYISGLIFNNKLLNEYSMTKYIKDNLQNEVCTYYPQVAWEMILSQYGNILGLDSILINEGDPEETEIGSRLTIDKSNKKDMPYYASIEGRLGQHNGFLEIIKTLEISENNFDILRELHMSVCRKTIFLTNLSIQVYYSKTDFDITQLLSAAYNQITEGLDSIYEKNKNSKKYLYKKDLEKIKANEIFQNIIK